MPSRQSWLATLVLAASLAAGVADAAEEPDRYSLGVFAGHRFGGELNDAGTGSGLELDEEPSAGLILGLRADARSFYELYYSRQSTRTVAAGPVSAGTLFDLDVHYLHLGGLVEYPRGALRAFFAAGIGLSYFDPAGPGLRSETRFSGNLGAGLRVPLGESLALRTELRALGSLFDSTSLIFCSGGGCSIEVAGDLLTQWELTLSLEARF